MSFVDYVAAAVVAIASVPAKLFLSAPTLVGYGVMTYLEVMIEEKLPSLDMEMGTMTHGLMRATEKTLIEGSKYVYLSGASPVVYQPTGTGVTTFAS